MRDIKRYARLSSAQTANPTKDNGPMTKKKDKEYTPMARMTFMTVFNMLENGSMIKDGAKA